MKRQLLERAVVIDIAGCQSRHVCWLWFCFQAAWAGLYNAKCRSIGEVNKCFALPTPLRSRNGGHAPIHSWQRSSLHVGDSKRAYDDGSEICLS